MQKLFCLVILTVSIVNVSVAQIGDFDTNADVGLPDIPGTADFADGTYTVDAVGSGVGDESLLDQLHFVYSELSGSFAIEASPFDVGGVGRGGLMVRQSIDEDSQHASLLMTGDFNVWPHIRFLQGGGSIVDGDPNDDQTVSIRIERIGNSVRLYRRDGSGELTLLNHEVLPLEETVLAGLAASGDGGFGFFEFTDVSIEELPLHVQRTLPSTDFAPGASFSQVTVTARARDGESVDAVINERAPSGSTVSNIQVSSGDVTDNGDGTIAWNLSGLSGEATMTYDLTLPNRSSVAWQGTFDDGIHEESYIGGVSVLPVNPTFTGPPAQPFEADPFFPVIIQVEDGENVADEGAFGLAVDPRVESGITIINVDANAADLIEFPINIPADGTYYLFGNVRGEDGNSDSWHFDIDFPPAGDDSSRWNIENAKEFELDWVEQEDPSNDPRPFELTAGEHFIYLAGREDSALLDWIAITTNPNIDLATFDPDATYLASRSLSDDLLEGGENTLSAELRVVLKNIITGSVIITETPPSGFELTNLNASAGSTSENADGSITWDVSGLTGQELTLSYDMMAPVVDTPFFQSGLFDGIISIANQNPQNIGGDNEVVVEGPAAGDTGRTVFHFIEDSNISLQDRVFASHLRNQFGLTVQQFDDDGTLPNSLDGAEFGIVSGSVGSGNIGGLNIHVNDPRPFITYESFLFDEFAFAPSGDPPTAADITTLELVNTMHPITEGLSAGNLQVHAQPEGVAYLANPPEGVTVLLTLPGNPDAAVVWVIDANTTVNGNNIPGIRIAWGIGDTNLTTAGKDFLNRVIAYVLGENAPEPPVSVDQFMLY